MVLQIKYFVAYGKWRPEIRTQEKSRKAVEEWTKKVEESGLKLLFWGSPYGTSEDSIFVYEGTVEDYLKLGQGAPYTDDRTHMVSTW
jgi:hypothetical protein